MRLLLKCRIGSCNDVIFSQFTVPHHRRCTYVHRCSKQIGIEQPLLMIKWIQSYRKMYIEFINPKQMDIHNLFRLSPKEKPN